MSVSKKNQSNKNYCTLYIVRHGETEWNLKRIIQGQRDSSLTEKGKKQALQLAKQLKKQKFDVIFSSDLLRAKRTAEIIALEHDLVVKTSNLIREKRYGSYEGKRLKTYFNELRKELEEYYRLPYEKKLKFKMRKDIESDEEVISRIITLLREISISYPNKKILIVMHGIGMTKLLIHLGFATHEELSPEQIGNTAYIKLLSDGVDFFIKETFGIKKSGVKLIGKIS